MAFSSYSSYLIETSRSLVRLSRRRRRRHRLRLWLFRFGWRQLGHLGVWRFHRNQQGFGQFCQGLLRAALLPKPPTAMSSVGRFGITNAGRAGYRRRKGPPGKRCRGPRWDLCRSIRWRSSKHPPILGRHVNRSGCRRSRGNFGRSCVGLRGLCGRSIPIGGSIRCRRHLASSKHESGYPL